MTTTNSSNYAAELTGKGPPPAPGMAQAVYSRTSKVHLLNTAAAADILNFHSLPPGSELVQAILHSDDLDSNVSPTITLDVGDADGAATIFSASTVAQAGGADTAQVRASLRKVYTVETLIFGTIHTVAATKAAGDVYLTTFFKMKGNPTS